MAPVDSAEWPDDNLIDTKLDELTAEMRELFLHPLAGSTPEIVAHEPGFDVFINRLRTKLAMEANGLLTLSPTEIWDSYYGIAPARGEAYLEDVNRTIAAIQDSLSDWEGSASEAFLSHLADVDSFITSQTRYIDDTLLRLTAAYTLAVQVREDFKNLVDTWITVSREFRKSDEERRMGVNLKVGAMLATTVIGAVFAPSALAAGLTMGAGALSAAVDTWSSSLGGASAQDVMDSYEREFGKLAQFYDNELEQLRTSVQGRGDEIAKEALRLYEPLPGICDINGPDFRYENFCHDTPPAGYEGRIEAERRKLAVERNEPDRLDGGPIYRALSGFETGEAR